MAEICLASSTPSEANSAQYDEKVDQSGSSSKRFRHLYWKYSSSSAVSFAGKDWEEGPSMMGLCGISGGWDWELVVSKLVGRGGVVGWVPSSTMSSMIGCVGSLGGW